MTQDRFAHSRFFLEDRYSVL